MSFLIVTKQQKQTDQKTSAMSSVVVKDDHFDTKSQSTILTANEVTLSARVLSSMQSTRAKGQKGVTVILVDNKTSTGTANTAFFPVYTLLISGVQDFSSFAAVYDECRVRAIDVHVQLIASANVLVAGANYGLAWDPGNPGAYSNVADVYTAMKHIGPISCSTGSTFPLSYTSSGYHKFPKIKPSALPVALSNGSSVMTSLAGGGWIATSDVNAVIGYLKGGVSPLGSAVTASYQCWVRYTVEFRCRT